ncbi:hypothetical protein SEUCBS139899_009719 [Sporothrix eucalyptigena]|uniref:Major facilitator superfamily (MFS) profile domain-containing protein n=1 Tax=Sporothrix eucalyptigena TaxID=1812306 RepID=A0ABP0B3X2_9PEZI
MGLGVLEPKDRTKDVPGTVQLEGEDEITLQATANLKHGTGRHTDVILAPQPSDSPNDPLNWSHAKKLKVSYLLSFGAALASGISQFLNPAATSMALTIHASVTDMTRSASLVVLCLGIGAILTAPLARIYGKRPVIFICTVFSIISYSLILARPASMKYIYAGRAFFGLFSAPVEYLVSSSVGDIFFVHQRGFHLALWHVSLSAGNSIGQVIGAQIVAHQSYIWAYRYAVIITAVYAVAFFFFVPETAFSRSKKLEIDINDYSSSDGAQIGSSNDEKQAPLPSSTVVGKQEETVSSNGSEDAGVPTSHNLPESYTQSLRLYRGRFSQESYIQSIFSPFVTLLLPGVSWAAYCYACTVAFSIATSLSLSSIFGAAPYNFSTGAIGLTVLSPFVGDIIGNLVPGPITDWLAVRLSRRNNGVYEPEFRIILCIPAFLANLAGYWGFGLAVHNQIHWFAPVFFFGLSAFGGQVLSLVSNAYLLDCHRQYARDGYAVVTLAKGVLTFAAGFFIHNWLVKSGPVQVFFLIGMINSVGAIWGLFLYFYGKRLRLRVHESTFFNNALRWAGNK